METKTEFKNNRIKWSNGVFKIMHNIPDICVKMVLFNWMVSKGTIPANLHLFKGTAEELCEYVNTHTGYKAYTHEEYEKIKK